MRQWSLGGVAVHQADKGGRYLCVVDRLRFQQRKGVPTSTVFSDRPTLKIIDLKKQATAFPIPCCHWANVPSHNSFKVKDHDLWGYFCKSTYWRTLSNSNRRAKEQIMILGIPQTDAPALLNLPGTRTPGTWRTHSSISTPVWVYWMICGHPHMCW